MHKVLVTRIELSISYERKVCSADGVSQLDGRALGVRYIQHVKTRPNMFEGSGGARGIDLKDCTHWVKIRTLDRLMHVTKHDR